MPVLQITPFAGLKTLPYCRTNEGGAVAETLPSAAAGLGPRVYVVQDAAGIVLTAFAGDTIRNGADVSSAGGTATSVTVGSVLVLFPINATEWIALSSVGVWVLA